MLLEKIKKYKQSFIPVVITGVLLSIVQLKVDNPMIILERFINRGGWIEIALLSLYAGFLFFKMKDVNKTSYWRKFSWAVFSIVFFIQLVLGLFGFEKFLMSGKLHFPIPAMIAAGAVYRFEFSFMPILFLSTVLLSGPAWCSQLCYFGAWDNIAALGKTKNTILKNKNLIKHSFLFLVIFTAIILRIFNLPLIYIIVFASIVGITGVAIIVFISPKNKKMIHCISYCPIGTLIMYFKQISPFRMHIDNSCTNCMRCTGYCKYDALSKNDIQKRKPALSCTYCGDCLVSCKTDSIKYKFLNLSSEASRNLYLIISISLHAIFLGLARI